VQAGGANTLDEGTVQRAQRRSRRGRGERTPVLYLAPWVDYGGSDKGTIDWFRWLDRERFEPSLICTQPSANRRLHEVEPYASEIWVLPDLMEAERFPWFIFDFIESRGIEVVHIMNSRLGFDLLPDFASLPRPPRIVVQQHVEEQTKDGYVRYVATRYGNLVDSFSVTSEQLARAIEDYDIPRGRIDVIYTGVDAEQEFSPMRAVPVEGLERDVVHLLYPGRLTDQKDPHLMVEVARRLREREEGFRIQVVGDGELAPEIQAAVRRHGLERHVLFHPPTREIDRWYAATDVLLMTSVFEGVPYVVYEAMAMGRPIVAPALAGNVELMGDEGGALIEPRDDVDAYVDHLVGLIRDPERRRQIGEASRARALERFSLRRMAGEHADLYDRLLDERPLPEPDESGIPPLPEPLRFTRRPVYEQPLVSVIVPCYNHGRYLRACLESIERQTYPAIETIVVDDGSTDPQTRELLGELETEPGLRVLRMERNGGPSAARNAAIDLARGRYVLPVDADNLLLEDAVELLVRQLQSAGEEVGFVYPNLQFFGNRDDYFEPPEFDVHLLLHGNYCDTSSLFDREIFDAGLRFDEGIKLGHEDWDFVLQLVERGVRGERARARTLLYRKTGFSRADAVDHAQDSFHEHVRRRHRALFGHRADRHPFVTIKARHAPEVSIVALAPSPERPAALGAQVCDDFELIGFSDRDWQPPAEGPHLVRLPAALEPDGPSRLALGLATARGRVVVVTEGSGQELLERRDFVERLIRLFDTEKDDVDGLVLAEGTDGGRAWRPIPREERIAGEPRVIAWRRHDRVTERFDRRDRHDAPVAVLPGEEVGSIVRTLTTRGARLDWRHWSAPVQRARQDGNARLVPLRRPPRRATDRATTTHHLPEYWPPALPCLEEPVRRWMLGPTWTPPLVTLLCRHREIGSERRIMTNTWGSPEGYELEHALGGVKTIPFRGTARLFALDRGGFAVVSVGSREPAPPSATLLGHLEEAAFPLLYPVTLGRHRDTGQQILVAGPDDNLRDCVEPIAMVGWVEPYPIEPRRTVLGEQRFGLLGLARSVDREGRRHRYAVGESPGGEPAGELGALLDRPRLDTIPLWLTEDGYVATGEYHPRLRLVGRKDALKWTLAPLRWRGRWRVRDRASGSARRAIDAAHKLRRRQGDDRTVEPVGAPLGHLYREGGPDRVPLHAAVHPVTQDQLLTTHAREAIDMGYIDVQLLGYLHAEAPAGGQIGPRTVVVPWASRFGEEAPRG
jgi:glycosyltransferase involved in cell wall biosynthesis/GT2 family glycosyltransferase